MCFIQFCLFKISIIQSLFAVGYTEMDTPERLRWSLGETESSQFTL